MPVIERVITCRHLPERGTVFVHFSGFRAFLQQELRHPKSSKLGGKHERRAAAPVVLIFDAKRLRFYARLEEPLLQSQEFSHRFDCALRQVE